MVFGILPGSFVALNKFTDELIYVEWSRLIGSVSYQGMSFINDDNPDVEINRQADSNEQKKYSKNAKL